MQIRNSTAEIVSYHYHIAITMCRYTHILSLPADSITPVRQGIFVTCGLCQMQSGHLRPRTTLKAKDVVYQGQGQGFWP